MADTPEMLARQLEALADSYEGVLSPNAAGDVVMLREAARAIRDKSELQDARDTLMVVRNNITQAMAILADTVVEISPGEAGFMELDAMPIARGEIDHG